LPVRGAAEQEKFMVLTIMLQDELCKSHKTNTMSRRCGKVSGRRHVKVITAFRYEILTAVLMNIQVFWNVTLCRMVNSSKCFNEAHCPSFID
jgi:hypothetical protein